VDDDEAGAMATTGVTITINDDAAPLVITMMMGMTKAIAMMVTTTILLTMAPATSECNNQLDDDNK
jgi:hypothetical protein